MCDDFAGSPWNEFCFVISTCDWTNPVSYLIIALVAVQDWLTLVRWGRTWIQLMSQQPRSSRYFVMPQRIRECQSNLCCKFSWECYLSTSTRVIAGLETQARGSNDVARFLNIKNTLCLAAPALTETPFDTLNKCSAKMVLLDRSDMIKTLC